MSGQFSVGVVIGGMIGSTFRSSMSGTRRALDSLSDTSRRLQERQNALTRATERYGQLGSSRMQHLNSELLRVSRTMEQIERQQRRLPIGFLPDGGNQQIQRRNPHRPAAQQRALGEHQIRDDV